MTCGPQRLFFFRGHFPGFFDDFIRPAFHLFADVPVILIDRIRRLMQFGVDQNDGSLPVLKQLFVGELFDMAPKAGVQPDRFDGIASSLEEDHRLAQFHVTAFPPALGPVDLPDHHDAAENEHPEEEQEKLVLAKEVHGLI